MAEQSRPRRLPDGLLMVGLGLLALAVRLASMNSSGGLQGTTGYDDGVYFAATNALLQHLTPYGDFAFLHPPGILLIAAGPVWLAHALGLADSDTLALVRVLFAGLGALNTVLVFLAGRHLSRTAGTSAAVLYAIWLPAIRVERSILLEPVVALGALAALALVPPVSNRAISGSWRPVLAGCVGGLAAATKLWALVAIVVVAGGLLMVRRWRTATLYLGSVAVTAALLVGPFAATFPDQMWRMVVADQFGRPPLGDSPWSRLALALGLDANPLPGLVSAHPPAELLLLTAPERTAFFAPERAHLVIGIALVVLVAVAALAAVRLPVARTWVVLLAAEVVVLLKVPTFFVGYAELTGPAIVLVAGAGVHLLLRALDAAEHRRTARVARGASVLVLGAGATALALGVARAPTAKPFPAEVTTLVADGVCVAADFPGDLALADKLSSNLHNGCPPVVDFSGVVYTMDRPEQGPLRPEDLRLRTTEFQLFALGYFASADRVILRRPRVDGLSRLARAGLRGRPVLHGGPPRVYGPFPSGVPEAR